MRKLMMALLGFLALVLFAEEDIRTAWSDYFAMDAGKTSVISVSGQVRISPIAEEESGTGMLLVDGEPAKGWTRYNPLWDTTSVTDGAHRLTLTGENVGVELYIINDNSTVYTHQGTLTRDEIWPADKPHLVTADVRIPIDKSLTIAEDAAIFFKTGTKIICQGGRVDFSPLVSEPFHLDVRSSRLATGIEYVSPVAVTESPEARLLVDGQPVNSWTRDNPWWDSRDVEEGRHLLALAGENVSVEVEVLRGTSAFVHEGVLAEDETWTADKEHIVTHWVHIPEGVSLTIADGATVRFCENTGLVNKGNLTWGNGLHLILDSIADGAFENFTNLSTVVLSDSVTSIGDNAFAGCTNLEEIVFSRNLTNIGENAFQRCAKLTSLRFPEGPTTIGAGAFSGCTRLKEIAFTGYPPVYQGTGRLFPHREALITAYRNDTRRWSGWKGYGWRDEAFNQVNVQLVDFPVSGDYTYQIDCRNCAWLVSYNGSDSVLELPEKLDDLSLWEIYKNAFYDKSFSRLTIPASVEMLREGAMGHVACDYLFFTGERPPQIADNDLCPNASPHLLVPETPGWNGVIEEGWIFHREAISYLDKDFGYRVEEDGTATITRYVGDSDMIVPDELSGHPVLTIPSGCFQNNSDITSVTIAKGVEHIGANAFQGCPNLATVTIGDSVTDIGANAFQGCPNLATVTIGDGVTDIGANAFKDCSKLATLTIGNSVTSIGDNAFQNCSSLTSVVIPDLVEEIPANAFSGCTNLVSVQLPYRLQSIDESAFNYNDSLEEIHFPGTPEQADTWLDFMPIVTLYVFADQGWPEVLDDDGTYFGLEVITGDDARLIMFYEGRLLNCYGGEEAISVSVSGDWTAVSNVPWLKVLTPAGTGNGEVRFAYELNPLETSRTGSISVSLTKYGVSKTIDVVQERFHYVSADLDYLLEDGQAVVINCVSEEETVVVPALLGGYPVARIADGAFANAPQVTTLCFQGALPAYEGEEPILSATGATVVAYRNLPGIDFGWEGTGAFGGLPVSLTDVPSEGNFLYAVGVDGVTLLRYVGQEAVVSVPEMLGGQPVTAIGGFSVLDDDRMTTLGAFESCASLTQLVVHAGVASVFSGLAKGSGLATMLVYGEPFLVEGEGSLLSADAVINVQADLGWEEALEADGTFHGATVAIHPRPLPEEMFIAEYELTVTTLDISALGGWTIAGVPAWLQLENTTGEGSQAIPATYQANPVEEDRSADLTVTLACGFVYQTRLTQSGQPVICALTVNGETTQVEQGTEVTATADPREGHDFTGWEATGIVLEHPENATQTFLMPRNAVTLTAVYVAHVHTLTVDGEASEQAFGTAIEVTAEDRTGRTFSKWTATGIKLANPKAKTQAFSMPDNDVKLTKTYTTNSYALTVNGETVQQKYGTTVAVTAEEREGYTFTQWTATGITLKTPKNVSQSFTMPAKAVTLEAVYVVNKHTLTINGVASEKDYGTVIEVAAEDRKRYDFTGWSAQGITLANPQAKSQSFAMPDNDVSLTANYTTEYVSHVYYLQVGWNLLTMVSNLDEESRDLLLPLNPIPWQADDNAFALTKETDLPPGTPLWVYSEDEKPLILYGKPLPDWKLTLNSGWNFVGIVKDIPLVSLPDTVNVQEWTGYEYKEKTKGTLEAGKAYWIFSE